MELISVTNLQLPELGPLRQMRLEGELQLVSSGPLQQRIQP
jgi:hypothetical protein